MQNDLIWDYRIWITIILGMTLGYVLMVFLPFFDKKPLLLLTWPLAGLFMIFMVTKPKWAIALILVFRPLLDLLLNMTKVDIGGGGGVGVGAIFNLIIVLLCLFLAFYSMNFPYKVSSVYLWSIFLFIMLISSSYSPFPRDAFRLCFNYLTYFALFLIPFLIIKNQNDFIFWLKVLSVSFILPILYANIDLLHGGHHFEDAGNRIMGTFTHPNILAFYLVLAFTVYFYILKSNYLTNRPMISLIIKILMINILVLLIATKSRNAWISIYIGFLIYGILKDRKVLITLLVMIPLMFIIPDIRERISTVLSSNSTTDYHGVNSFEWRLQLWKYSLPKILERPLQGFGLSSFQPSTEKFFSIGQGMHAHNTYLETLFETGIIGLLSFVVIFLNPLIIFFKNMRLSINKIQAQIWAIMVGYLISYMLICSADNLSFYLTFNWYVWFFIGLMLVASYKNYSVCLETKNYKD